MKIVFSSGHGQKIQGATGSPVPPQCNEVATVREIVEAVATKWRASGIEVITFHDNVSTSQNENLNRIVNFHNSQGPHDWDLSCHLNAYDGSAHGCEVLYLTQPDMASKASAAIAAAGHFTNRGGKKRTDLFFLNSTHEKALLYEVFFCDHTGDCNLYAANKDAIAEAIAESLTGIQVPDTPTEPPPEEIETPTEENRVDIDGHAEGDVAVTINGTLVYGRPRSRSKITMTIKMSGDVVVALNGEEFHNKPAEPEEPEAPPPSDLRMLGSGDTGTDVARVQTILGIPADGDFGQQTDGAVRGFQAAMGLAVDGIVGENTWEALIELEAKVAVGTDGISAEMYQRITEIARNSAVNNHYWDDRGKSPKGYIPGMALAFALAVNAWEGGESAAQLMAQANTHLDDTDALSWYNSTFEDLDMDNSRDGLATLRHLFVLLTGLGMRESSGDHWCGRDMSADNVAPDTAEAGLFQSSWNLNTASAEISKLFDAYWKDPNGFQETFSQGLNPDGTDLQNYGSGAKGTQHQFLSKYCPAYACFMTAIGLRTRREHWGPINRHEVEVLPEADEMLLEVQRIVLPEMARR